MSGPSLGHDESINHEGFEARLLGLWKENIKEVGQEFESLRTWIVLKKS